MASIKTPSDSTLIPTKGSTSILTAWRISFSTAVILIVLLPILFPDPYWEIMRFLPDGILRTFQVTIFSMCFALLIGFISGLGQISHNKIFNIISAVYVETIRGIPLLVQLFYIYFALGRIIQVPRLTAAIIAISFCYGAYLSEIFRSGIAAIHKGQTEAGLALGMSRWQVLWYIIIPQTLRAILPPIGNEFIAMLKDSSLVSILAVSDLLRRGREFASVSFLYFETYTLVALVYLVITLFLSKIVGLLEDRFTQYE